ncbi:MAG: TonB-dependent receptor [Bryobacteraceae bacterium]|nr:TonB-dependent receptor [Bryobacteraceae bacterium]MDW8377446.1 TonB-dependent receptor [Bryobacterales bacterium]
MNRPLFTLWILLLGFSAAGQEYRGTLQGRVSDASGARIVGARVAATNTATNQTLFATTNEVGEFRLPFVIPGDYLVTAEAVGFKKAVLRDVRVNVQAAVELDFRLELGDAAESVTVTDKPPLLNLSNADLGQVIDSQFINVINPTLTRNAMNLVQLAAGVSGGTGTVTSFAANSFSIQGGGSLRGGNEFLVDGMPSLMPSGGGIVSFVPSLDSVAEVKVQTTLFDAQFGRSNGGAVNVTTKGGTNELHGVGYWFKRWAALNANSWTNNRLGLPRPPVKYDQYGFFVSGPVILPKLYNGKSRTFWSVAFEEDADARELTRQQRVPTALEKQGNFSQTLNQRGQQLVIYDPATTLVAGNRATRQPFPGAIIPAARFNPTGRAYLQAYPEPNLAGATTRLTDINWSAGGVYVVEQGTWNTRLDHQISPSNRLFGRLSRMRRLQNPDQLIRNVYSYAGTGTTDNDVLRRDMTSIALDDTHTFSPTLIATFRYGFSRYYTRTTIGAVNVDPASFQLPSQVIEGQAVRGLAILNLGEGLPSFGSALTRASDNQHTLLATFNKQFRKHAVKWGLDYRLLDRHSASPGANAAGQFNFGTLFTREDPFNPASGQVTGTSMAALLLGLPESGAMGGNTALSYRNHYWGLFFQDDWRVTGRLTLNLGLRWELETPFVEKYNRIAYGFDENARFPFEVPGLELRGGLLYAGVGGNPRRMGQTDWNNFGPRFGLAFQLNERTVLRGGYGVFFSSQAIANTSLLTVGTFNAVTQFVATTDNATPFTTLANPFPGGLVRPLGSSPGLAGQAGDVINVFDPVRVSPYNQQWQFSIQRELPANILVDVGYVGSHSVKQFETFNLNERPDFALPLGNALNQTVPNPFRGILPATSPLGQGATITRERLLLRYPQYSAFTVQAMNTGRGLYHSLQVNVNKRVSHGLAVIFNHTFSRLMDNNTTSVINPRQYRSVSSLDQKHILRLAATYDFPWKFRHRFAQTTLGGWKVAGLYRFLTGLPLSVSHPNGRPIRIRNPRLSGPVSQRLGDRTEGGVVVNPYFDTGAFVPYPTPFVVPADPPALDELRAPSESGLNFNLFKRFPIRERLQIEARLEGANVLNSPNFGAPGTNLNALATFGVITSAGGNRSMQGALRILF